MLLQIEHFYLVSVVIGTKQGVWIGTLTFVVLKIIGQVNERCVGCLFLNLQVEIYTTRCRRARFPLAPTNTMT